MRHLKCSLCLLTLPKESLGYTALMGAPPKVQPMFVSLPKESLSYTVLTGPKARVWLALSSKKKATVRFAKNQALFSLNVTPYVAKKTL